MTDFITRTGMAVRRARAGNQVTTATRTGFIPAPWFVALVGVGALVAQQILGVLKLMPASTWVSVGIIIATFLAGGFAALQILFQQQNAAADERQQRQFAHERAMLETSANAK